MPALAILGIVRIAHCYALHTLARFTPTTRRYCPRRSLPQTPYLPGQGPRPSLDSEELHADAWDGSGRGLLVNSEFRWGVDLYNCGYYWEAHEAWEDLWRLADKQSSPRLLLQGLIQCSGAALKGLVGQNEGRARLGLKGLAKLEAATSEPYFAGLKLENFRMEFRQFCADQSDSAAPPKIVLAR